MGSKREDVDLELVLKDPNAARLWVQNFNWDSPERPKYIVIDMGLDAERIIYFDHMTDAEAVEVAGHLLRSYEIRRAVHEYNLLSEREIH